MAFVSLFLRMDIMSSQFLLQLSFGVTESIIAACSYNCQFSLNCSCLIPRIQCKYSEIWRRHTIRDVFSAEVESPGWQVYVQDTPKETHLLWELHTCPSLCHRLVKHWQHLVRGVLKGTEQYSTENTACMSPEVYLQQMREIILNISLRRFIYWNHYEWRLSFLMLETTN